LEIVVNGNEKKKDEISISINEGPKSE